MASQPPGDETDRGLRWIGWSLLLFLGIDIAIIATLLVLTPFLLDAIANRIPPIRVESWLATASLVFGVLEAAAGALYVIGFADVYGSRGHHGAEHVRFVRRALVYLCVTVGLIFGGDLVPSFTGPFFGVPGITPPLPSWALSTSVIIPGLRALFAALALLFAVGELAADVQRSRLLVAMVLGVVGAVAWPGAIAYAVAAGGSPEGPVTALVAGVVAGLGTSVISLLLFLATIREIRQGLGETRHSAS